MLINLKLNLFNFKIQTEVFIQNSEMLTLFASVSITKSVLLLTEITHFTLIFQSEILFKYGYTFQNHYYNCFHAVWFCKI